MAICAHFLYTTHSSFESGFRVTCGPNSRWLNVSGFDPSKRRRLGFKSTFGQKRPQILLCGFFVFFSFFQLICKFAARLGPDRSRGGVNFHD